MKTCCSFFFPALVFCVVFMCSCALQNGSERNFADRDTLGFHYIDLVHVTHTDYGFTDHPVIAIDLHKRYIDIALDPALHTRREAPENRCVWTVEALDPFYLWWQEASDVRSQLDIEAGMQHDVNGFPRAAATNLLDKGVKYLCTGINI